MTAFALTLMVVGALLELAGVALVALDIRTSGRHARELGEKTFHWAHEGRTWAEISEHLLAHAQPVSVRSGGELYQRDEILAQILKRMLSGDRRRRILAVALLVSGLVLATAGNVVSLLG